MGPRPEGRGEERCSGGIEGEDQASMGPRPEGRGENLGLAQGRDCLLRFNGATARRPWRVSRSDTSPSPLKPASMGPRPEGRGEAGYDWADATWDDTLQWGHGPKAVESSYQFDLLRQKAMLQWGHGPKAVESDRPAARISSSARASMGPRPEGRGERPRRLMTPGSQTSLQWGHGPKAVESRIACTPAILPRLLQWGHGPKAVERVLYYNTSLPIRCASMGPRPEGRGEDREGYTMRFYADPLQWGHGPKAVERT